MGNIAYRIKNGLYRSGMRILMPDLARQMLKEGNLSLPKDSAAPAEGATPPPEFIHIKNRGADITVFAFAGLDVLYAGMARYEFHRILHQLHIDANLVLVRDVQRMGFQLKPDGSPGGPEFYGAELLRVKNLLGATRNIAIGSSIGGSAAFFFGTLCEMDEVILFGAAFNLDGFSTRSMLRRTALNIRLLLTEPRAYVELFVVTLAARWARKNFISRIGEENISKPLELYENAAVRPAITLFYGVESLPDKSQAMLLLGYPETRLIPLPTGRHNIPAFLKQQGILTARIAEALNNPPGRNATDIGGTPGSNPGNLPIIGDFGVQQGN
jgi:hypothetical protein